MSEEPIVLSYPETMETLIQESVNLLEKILEYTRRDDVVPVTLEIAVEDHLNICAKLGWKPNAVNEQTGKNQNISISM